MQTQIEKIRHYGRKYNGTNVRYVEIFQYDEKKKIYYFVSLIEDRGANNDKHNYFISRGIKKDGIVLDAHADTLIIRNYKKFTEERFNKEIEEITKQMESNINFLKNRFKIKD